MKRLFSFLLALVMMAGLCVPALASEEAVSEPEVITDEPAIEEEDVGEPAVREEIVEEPAADGKDYYVNIEGFRLPVAGQKPVTASELTVTDSKGREGYVDYIHWSRGSDVFIANETYRVSEIQIVIPDTKYGEFFDIIYLNGSPSSFWDEHGSGWDISGRYTEERFESDSFTAASNSIIVDGFDLPEKDAFAANAEKLSLVGNPPYTIGGIQWFLAGSNTPLSMPLRFQAGVRYDAVILLKLKDFYEFKVSDAEKIVVRLPDGTERKVDYAETTGRVMLLYLYNIAKEVTLDNLTIVLPKPAVGQRAGAVQGFISNTTACNITKTQWRDDGENRILESGETFRAGREYTAILYADCLDGYVLASTGSGMNIQYAAAATVNGDPVTLNGYHQAPEGQNLDPHYAKILYKVSLPASPIPGGVSIDGTVVYHGDTVSCSLTGAAASIPASKLHYQWQTSPDKKTWTDVSGATGKSWQTPSGGSATAYARVVVTADGYTGQLTSDARALNVKSSSSTAISGSVTIRQTSEDETSFVLGKEIKGTYRNSAGVISTAPGLFYQWQRSANNANWEDIPGAATSAYTPTAADEGYWLRLVVTSKYSVGELYSGSKRVEPTPPTVKLSADGKSAQATNFDGLYARVALVLQNGGTSGLYVTQATINPDGTIVIPSFMVPGLTVKGVNIALVPTLADISSSTPNAKASDFKML